MNKKSHAHATSVPASVAGAVVDHGTDTARRLQDVALALLGAHEDASRRVARELHDQLGQALATAVLNLELCGDAPVPPDVRDEVLADLRQALARMRDLSLNLHPALLHQDGLGQALGWLAHRQAGAAGLAVAVTVDAVPAPATPVIETVAYRIVQEALANAVCHARASRVDIAVQAAEDGIRITVTDDGIGFDPQAVAARPVEHRLGLHGMRARAALVGGACEVVSSPGKGAAVRAWLPLVPRLPAG